jgi:hypothetical protein
MEQQASSSWKHKYDEMALKYNAEVETNIELGRRIEVWKSKCSKEYAQNAQIKADSEVWKSKYKSVIRNPANVKLGALTLSYIICF